MVLTELSAQVGVGSAWVSRAGYNHFVFDLYFPPDLAEQVGEGLWETSAQVYLLCSWNCYVPSAGEDSPEERISAQSRWVSSGF